MNREIQENLNYLKWKGFEITDEEKTIWYLEKVGLHRLQRYFNTVDSYQDTDFQKIIDAYIFDKKLRIRCLEILEPLENSLKSIIALNFPNYLESWIYSEKYREARLWFLYYKVSQLRKVDIEIKKFSTTEKIPAWIFLDKLHFWEVLKIFKDLKPQNKEKISSYYWINLNIFESWLDSLWYLRNLSSHWENIFNRKMTISFKGKDISESTWVENHYFISYLLILILSQKVLIPNYNWEQQIFILMQKYKISFRDFWTKKETFPSELESEAWKVLVDTLYLKYIKK